MRIIDSMILLLHSRPFELRPDVFLTKSEESVTSLSDIQPLVPGWLTGSVKPNGLTPQSSVEVVEEQGEDPWADEDGGGGESNKDVIGEPLVYEQGAFPP